MTNRIKKKRIVAGLVCCAVVIFPLTAWMIERASTLEAIQMAKQAHTLRDERSNADEIRRELAKARGVIEVGKWDSTGFGNDTHLVVLEFKHNGGRMGYVFEVNVKHQLVRNVFESPSLMERYGFPVFRYDKDKPNEVVKLVREQFPEDPRGDGEITLESGRWAERNRPDWFEEFPQFFHHYISISDILDHPANRLHMPTPAEFLEERKLAAVSE